MWKWFKSAVDTVTADKFRIKIITLKDGTKKYYPQYKGDTTNWLDLLVTDKEQFILIGLTDYQLLNDEYQCDSQELAQDTINLYKKLLVLERAKNLESEEVIKID